MKQISKELITALRLVLPGFLLATAPFVLYDTVRFIPKFFISSWSFDSWCVSFIQLSLYADCRKLCVCIFLLAEHTQPVFSRVARFFPDSQFSVANLRSFVWSLSPT